MKKILLSSVALLTLSAGAFAADLPARRMAPVAPAFTPVPAFTWTGFYIGANAGYGFGTNEDSVVLVPTTPARTTFVERRVSGEDNDGFIGGGQVGYNIQFGTFVVGIEADLQYADLSGDDEFGFDFDSDFNGVNDRRITGGGSSLEYFGTVRGRAGFAFDRVLIYATGGFAYGGLDDRFCRVGTVEVNCGGDDAITGWTVGGGVEWALPTNLSLFGSSAVTFGIEGLWVNLENDDDAIVDQATGVTFPAGQDIEFGLVRAKLNFKF